MLAVSKFGKHINSKTKKTCVPSKKPTRQVRSYRNHIIYAQKYTPLIKMHTCRNIHSRHHNMYQIKPRDNSIISEFSVLPGEPNMEFIETQVEPEQPAKPLSKLTRSDIMLAIKRIVVITAFPTILYAPIILLDADTLYLGLIDCGYVYVGTLCVLGCAAWAMGVVVGACNLISK
jgi:hypothetical protein